MVRPVTKGPLPVLFSLLMLTGLGACASSQQPALLADQSTTPTTGEPASPLSTLTVVGPTSTTTTEPPAELPPLVVYDTDMGADVDDVLALAMLHAYADRGLVEIGAVTISRNSEAAAHYADAVNTFYGRPDIPIGIHKSSYVDFNDRILFTSTAGSWPHDLDVASLPDGFQLLRRLLVEAEADEREVIIVQTGFSGNLSALLKSDGDDVNPRNGIDLVADTVSLLSIMAGSTEYGIVEFNIKHDIGSARYVFWKWPTRLALSPFELGDAIHYPYSSITNDFGWVERHPVREAYEFKDIDWHRDAPPYYDMKAWDLTSVMYAVEADSGMFKVSDVGQVTVAEDGRTTFTPGAVDGARQDVVLDRGGQYTPEEKQAVVNRMIELVSAQPNSSD